MRVKKSELSARVAAEASLSRADADTAVNAVLGSIGDALARGGDGQHRGVRDVLGEGPPGPAGTQPTHGRDHRDRRFEGTVVQGREGASGRRALAAVSVLGDEPMAVKDVTMAGVETALEEFRRIGLDAMLENYGGRPSTRWYVEVGSRQYDQKVLVRAAHVRQGLGELPPRGPGRFNAGQAKYYLPATKTN